MTKDLLWRGMLAGILAALLATLFARAFAEPQVDLAIAFEAAKSTHAAHAMAGHVMETPAADEPELVSRATQAGIGLLTAALLYGAAVGGIFSLVFAYCYGRLIQAGPRSVSLILAMLAFVVIAVVPVIKYPSTPPAVGQHETVGLRTAAYFGMIALSIVAAMIANRIRLVVDQRSGRLNGLLAAAGSFVAIVALAQVALPVINEVPDDYPATLLWNFRIASIGMQLVLWTVIGLAFGTFAETVLRRHAGMR